MIKETIEKQSLDELLSREKFICECGRTHTSGKIKVIIENDAISELPNVLNDKTCKKPFIISGKNTFNAVGNKIINVLEKAQIAYSAFVYEKSPVTPTEETLGRALMHYDFSCDSIIAVGSGVINDTAKFLAKATNNELILVATAASMDGFLSATSSMDRDALKVSIPTDFAHTIIGDLDVLSECPSCLLQAGIGDMIAKYVSLVEWRVSHLITGEYYCPIIDTMVETARDKVVKAAEELNLKDKNAVKQIMEGLIIAGLAMNYAGVSRPASGMEHYFSHIWDMRSLAFPDAKHDLHGIQCGMGTLISLKVWEYIRTIKPDREKAISYAESFDRDKWFDVLREFIGPGAEQMITGELNENKYDVDKHKHRLNTIIGNWDEIVKIASTLPKYEDVLALLERIGAPISPEEIGYDGEQLILCFKVTKDIRDKYIGTRLLWDLGELDEAANYIFRC